MDEDRERWTPVMIEPRMLDREGEGDSRAEQAKGSTPGKPPQNVCTWSARNNKEGYG